jgi:hypothetical protein
MNRAVTSGKIKLFGSVGGDRYEQTYPISIEPTSSAGNAFVPRLYAATKMGDLEANQGDGAKEELIELSKKFAVASRYTSLLVLESEAMFKAFGIERNTSIAPLWTGEEVGESSGSDGDIGYALRDSEPEVRGRTLDDMARPKSAPAPPMVAGKAMPPLEDRRERPGRRMVPMRRVWDRKGQVHLDTDSLSKKASEQIERMQREVTDNPDSRNRLEKLLGLYAVTGQVERASELAERWAERDALDPGALAARAEAAARQGNRSQAIRVLGGLADVRPGDPEFQNWLARLHESAGDDYLACSHRIALASLRMKEASTVADAIRCARKTQRHELASLLESDVEESIRVQVERELGKTLSEEKLRGDIRIEATWDESVDLDIALIGPNGQRYSWLGDPKGRVSSKDATSKRSETLAVFNAPKGDYVVEVTRANHTDSSGPIRGTMKIRAVGSPREIPFVLSGPRTDVARIRIYYTSRLVPLSSW